MVLCHDPIAVHSDEHVLAGMESQRDGVTTRPIAQRLAQSPVTHVDPDACPIIYGKRTKLAGPILDARHCRPPAYCARSLCAPVRRHRRATGATLCIPAAW